MKISTQKTVFGCFHPNAGLAAEKTRSCSIIEGKSLNNTYLNIPIGWKRAKMREKNSNGDNSSHFPFFLVWGKKVKKLAKNASRCLLVEIYNNQLSWKMHIQLYRFSNPQILSDSMFNLFSVQLCVASIRALYIEDLVYFNHVLLWFQNLKPDKHV